MGIAVGTRLGPYEIVAPLGAGGMGEVYRARDTRLGRDVALKTLPPEVADDASRRQRFELEARAVAALNHPNIVALYDVGEGYIVSELVDGESLRGQTPGLRKTIDIAVQIANGLAAAHAAGITHRDLKPENILLTRDGRVKILDFGLAKMTAPAAAAATETVTVQTEPGVVMGTVGYMSPEQIRGQTVDHRSDIFSFGLILYELLAGRRAFAGETSVDTMQAILRQEAPELPETVPTGLRQIVGHCMEKEAGNRFQSARDLGFALSALGYTGSHSAAVAAASAASRRWLRMGALGVLAAAAIGAVALWLRPTAPSVWSGALLGGPEVAMAPSLSPDGHLLAFLSSVEQVGVMKLESGDYATLTHATNQGFSGVISWSPDGARIYYDRWTDIPRGIYSVSVLGGDEQLVVEDAALPEALPDGSLLLSRYNSERQFQLTRFWPDTGRSQALPIQVPDGPYQQYRGFPDGTEAVVLGTGIGPGQPAGVHLFRLDLRSGQVRLFLSPPEPWEEDLRYGITVTRDGKSVLVGRPMGNMEIVESISRDGRRRTPLSLTLTNGTNVMDTGPDGSIYLDQWSRNGELLRFPPEGGKSERLTGLPPYEAPGSPWGHDEALAVLADGRVVLTVGTGGRKHLIAVEAGKEPVRLVNTTEETAAPVTAVGRGEVAFLIGPEPKRTIAVATTSNGRILRRIPFDQGPITSLASTPDGKTLFCAAGGNIWAIPLGGGEPRRLRAGDHAAVDPEGRYLVVEVTENPMIRLIQVPLDGGSEREIPTAGGERPAFYIGPNAVGPGGRIVMPIGSSTWYWPAGIQDSATARFRRIPVDTVLDYHGLAWTPDGKVIGLGLETRSRLWRFTPQAQ
jgi:predicted Ser/Thr protein kinase